MRYTEEQLHTMGLQKERIPRHVAIIMDGNGRWATARGLSRSAGHRQGVNALREIIRFSSDIGVEALTLYAFSTENRKRPGEEIGVLCALLIEYFNREIDELHQNEVCIRSIGELSWFPQNVQEAVRKAEERTRENCGLKLNIALNYGAQNEILRAVRTVSQRAIETGELPTQEQFEEALDTRGLPPVDLLIRTSGELRLSNFLLYQLAYAELYFTDAYWPDFSKDAYADALKDFGKRKRRFGDVKEARK